MIGVGELPLVPGPYVITPVLIEPSGSTEAAIAAGGAADRDRVGVASQWAVGGGKPDRSPPDKRRPTRSPGCTRCRLATSWPRRCRESRRPCPKCCACWLFTELYIVPRSRAFGYVAHAADRANVAVVAVQKVDRVHEDQRVVGRRGSKRIAVGVAEWQKRLLVDERSSARRFHRYSPIAHRADRRKAERRLSRRGPSC